MKETTFIMWERCLICLEKNVYVFMRISKIRQRDTIYRHLPFEQRLQWLRSTTSKQGRCEMMRLETRIANAKKNEHKIKLEAQKEAVSTWLAERTKKEAAMRTNPIKRRADKQQRKQLHEKMIVALHHKNGELAPCDIEKRLLPVGKFLYKKFLKPDESNYPKIAPSLKCYLGTAYTIAFLWMVMTSVYPLSF